MPLCPVYLVESLLQMNGRYTGMPNDGCDGKIDPKLQDNKRKLWTRGSLEIPYRKYT